MADFMELESLQERNFDLMVERDFSCEKTAITSQYKGRPVRIMPDFSTETLKDRVPRQMFYKL